MFVWSLRGWDLMSGFGRTAEPVAAPQGHFLMLFSTTFTAPVAGIFLLLVQKKGTKEKDTRKLVGIFNPNSLASKEKQALAAQRTLSGFIMDTPPSGSG